MSILGAEYHHLRQGSEDWGDLSEFMESTSRDFGGASVSALPSRVQSAAQTFLRRWEGYAQESSAIAEGFSGALDVTQRDLAQTDDATGSGFSDLDGRLGPAR